MNRRFVFFSKNIGPVSGDVLFMFIAFLFPFVYFVFYFFVCFV